MSETSISDSETEEARAAPGRAASSRWLPEWNGRLYAANTGHHRVFDAWFLERLPVRSTDRVLDIGCGSGDFTSTIADLVPDGEVVGLDPSPSMLDEARRHARPNQSFVLGAAQDLRTLLADVEPFDVVMSRAAMHWIPLADHPAVHAGVCAVIRRDGWYRIEAGGAGNIAPIAAFLTDVAAHHRGPASPWTFLDAAQALELLEDAGFAVEPGAVRLAAQRRAFTRDALLGWFRSQTFQAFAPAMAPSDHAAFCAEVEERVDELVRRDGTYDQTWVRLDVLVRKP